MNIVIICFRYPPVYSGYGKQLKSVIEKILTYEDKFNFTILTAYKESSYNNENISVIPMLDNDKSKNDIFKFSKKIMSWLYNNRKSIDAIHCIKAGPEAIVSNIISKVFNIPLIIKIAQDELSVRELEHGSIIHKIIRKIRHKFLGTAHHFIAISKEIENNIQNNKLETGLIHKIPNGVDTERFSEVSDDEKEKKRKVLGFKKNETIILYTGSMDSRKGIPEFLESLKLLKINLDVRVVLCGPVSTDIIFHDFITEFNKQRKNITIDYQGKVDNPEIYMQIADIFILPSHSEGLPNVLLEAGSTGLPLIATNIGGSNEIVIDNYNGYIIPINSKTDIANSLQKLLTNDELRKKFGVNSRDHVVNKYSLDIVANKYIELYDKLTQTS